MRNTVAVSEAGVEDMFTQLRSHLRPGMTAVAVGGGLANLEPLLAERVGPSGRVVAIETPARPAQLEGVLPYDADLILLEFWPQRLREARQDPVWVLDSYRAIGLRASGATADLPDDPGELVLAVDGSEPGFAILRLEPVEAKPPPQQRLLSAGRRLGRRTAARFPRVEPRTLGYDATQRALVSSVLGDEDWMDRFESGAQLPFGLGAGFDERVVEYPWLFSRGLSGRVLDAGSVLNHRHVLEPLLPEIDDLTIVTLAPEPAAFTELGVSYLYGDLRDLALRDEWFDEVVCLSTLEHVGMDNSPYGVADPRAEDPRAESARALGELLRVVRPGGRVHLSVPFGRREDHGWLRQLDREDVDDLLARVGAARHEETVFHHTRRGWRRGSAGRVRRARYNDSAKPARDGAVAAHAVLCATIQRVE